MIIASITSCTNTSNPAVMLAAGLLAKKAVEAGLSTRPWVKTTLAPGSVVVTNYLREAGLLPYLEKLGFHVAGYGCATCIGNSGPIADGLADAIRDNKLAAACVVSGNRNFEGRIHPSVRASFLASPPLVVWARRNVLAATFVRILLHPTVNLAPRRPSFRISSGFWWLRKTPI